jgi:hypothetical protein
MAESNTNVFRYKVDTVESTNIPEVHPVLIVISGTTLAELAVVLASQNLDVSDSVPYRVVVIDSLPYEDIVNRLVQNNWTREQVLAALPRANYFHLASPFADAFDFDNPLSRDWRTTIFEPALERLASKPEAPGCAGTPALGRARVEGNEAELQTFFETHLHELTQVRTETLGLQPGVTVFMVTTFRGGTGTGAVVPGGAVLRSTLAEGTIHLHAIMPDVYSGDYRAHANAYAAVRELQNCHRFGEMVPFKGGRQLPAPFDTTTLIFASNGAVALRQTDALMQEAAILGAYLRARSQSSINSRLVDLTDVAPYTIEDDPMHVRVETAVSIRNVLPGTLEYIVGEWIRQKLEANREDFELWCQTADLPSVARLRVREIAQQALLDLNLDPASLLARLESVPSSANKLRNFFEQVSVTLSSMDSETIKQNIASVPSQVRALFQKFEADWEERGNLLARELPREIVTYVMSRLSEVPHLGLAVISQILETLTALIKDCRADAANEQKRRDEAASQLSKAMSSVQESRGILGIFNRNEVTRDAAQQACAIALRAAQARADQQRLEGLSRLLESDGVSMNAAGTPVPIPAVINALRSEQLRQMALTRTKQSARLEEVRRLLDELSQRIEKRSQVFNRALIYDQIDLQRLNQVAREMSEGLPLPEALRQFLKGEATLAATISEMLPLVPFYVEAGRSLPEVLENDADKRGLVLALLRNRQPFTPLDRVVEDQQGLRNRRDSLTILQVPGGPDSELAALMLREGIVSNLNQIVDSGDDEIRLYLVRDGLPYAAIRPLARYKERHDNYLSNPAAITPYTRAGSHLLPGLEPSRVNLRTRTEEIVYVAKAVLPGRVETKPSGGLVLRYEKDTGHGFPSLHEESFAAVSALVLWLAKQVFARKSLEAELADTLDRDPAVYRDKLLTSWSAATGKEREYLQEALYKVKVDPLRFVKAQQTA